MLVGYNVGLHKVDYVKCWTINKKYMALGTWYCLTSAGKAQP